MGKTTKSRTSGSHRLTRRLIRAEAQSRRIAATVSRQRRESATRAASKTSDDGSQPPRKAYKLAPEAGQLALHPESPSALWDSWAYLLQHLVATVPDLMAATGHPRKTVESHLWNLRQMGLIYPVKLTGPEVRREERHLVTRGERPKRQQAHAGGVRRRRIA